MEHAGFLCKQGKETGLAKNWKWRWCELCGCTLSYYADPPALAKQPQAPRGTIDLADTTIIPCRVPDKGENCFVIRHPQRRDFYLQAPSTEDMLTWLDMLKTVTNQSLRQSVGFSFTLAAPSCPLIFHEVEFLWHDTSFPLGIDFKMLQGGAIGVTDVHGEARAQTTQIQKNEIVVALNGVSVKGWSMEKFVQAIRDAAPGSNPKESGLSTGSETPPCNKRVSVKISFTFARKTHRQKLSALNPNLMESMTSDDASPIGQKNKPLPSPPSRQSMAVTQRRSCGKRFRLEKGLSLGRGAKKLVQGIHWDNAGDKKGSQKKRSYRSSWCNSISWKRRIT